MLSHTATPVEMTIPIEASGEVKRRLVLRNPLSDDALVMKLQVNPKNDDAIQLSHEFVRISPRTLIYVNVTINTSRLGLLSRVGHEIRGYAKIAGNQEANVRWLRTEGSETERQLAFSLMVRSNNAFSAYDTIVDLPGRATLVEPLTNARLGIDDKGTEDAIPVEADTITARPFGSLEQVAVSLRPGFKMAGESCWFWDMANRFATSCGVMGLEKQPPAQKVQSSVQTARPMEMRKSCVSLKENAQSNYVDSELRVPCKV